MDILILINIYIGDYVWIYKIAIYSHIIVFYTEKILDFFIFYSSFLYLTNL